MRMSQAIKEKIVARNERERGIPGGTIKKGRQPRDVKEFYQRQIVIEARAQ